MNNIAVPVPGYGNVMSFCSHRLDPKAVNEIIKANPQEDSS